MKDQKDLGRIIAIVIIILLVAFIVLPMHDGTTNDVNNNNDTSQNTESPNKKEGVKDESNTEKSKDNKKKTDSKTDSKNKDGGKKSEKKNKATSTPTPSYRTLTVKTTAYCGCPSCSGQWGTQTATGTQCVEGRTIAVDPSIIPLGSKVEIDGHIYTAEDVGGGVKGKHIDIYFASHAATDAWGVRYKNIKVY